MAVTNKDTVLEHVDIATAAKALIATGQESPQWATKLKALIVAAQNANDGMGTHKLYLVNLKNDIYLSTSSCRDGLYLGQVDIRTKDWHANEELPSIGVHYRPAGFQIPIGEERIPLGWDGRPKITITKIAVRSIVKDLVYIIEKWREKGDIQKGGISGCN